MRCKFWAAGVLLTLTGCYADQGLQTPGYGYAASPDYGPYGYAPSGYPPGYASPDYPPVAYPGYSYNSGAPTIVESGVAVPLVFYGGEWGYYDRRRSWHRAPDAVYRDLQRRQAFNRPPYPGAIPPGQPNWQSGRPPPPPPQQHPFLGGAPAGFQPPPQQAHPFLGGAPPAPRPAPPPAPHAAPPPPPPGGAHPFLGG